MYIVPHTNCSEKCSKENNGRIFTAAKEKLFKKTNFEQKGQEKLTDQL